MEVTLGEDSALHAATNYRLKVAACTAAGCTYSQSVGVTTKARRPSGLAPPVITNVTTTSVDVSWQPPTEPNGNITQSVTFLSYTCSPLTFVHTFSYNESLSCVVIMSRRNIITDLLRAQWVVF